MGRYTNEASSYKMGMDMLSSSLEKIASDIEKAGNLVANEDSQDALNYYVTSFNNDIKGAIDSLIAKCTALSFAVTEKAKEIDTRIELEQQALINEQTEESLEDETSQGTTQDISSVRQERDEVLRNDRLDVNNKMRW